MISTVTTLQIPHRRMTSRWPSQIASASAEPMPAYASQSTGHDLELQNVERGSGYELPAATDRKARSG